MTVTAKKYLLLRTWESFPLANSLATAQNRHLVLNIYFCPCSSFATAKTFTRVANTQSQSACPLVRVDIERTKQASEILQVNSIRVVDSMAAPLTCIANRLQMTGGCAGAAPTLGQSTLELSGTAHDGRRKVKKITRLLQRAERKSIYKKKGKSTLTTPTRRRAEGTSRE